MARVGGRNSWIAVPAGLVCAAIVGALVWLSLPMIPVTVAWLGDSLRRSTEPQPAVAPSETPAQLAIAGGAIDCRTLYPDELWNELVWNRAALLNQTVTAPVTEVTSLTDALAPEVLVTCQWRLETGGSIVTTLSRVGDDAVGIADAALRGQGFACESNDAQVVCTRTQGSVVEEHSFRDGMWLASVETEWHPDGYGARLDRNVYG
ncbi:hypothetical protein [Microbacterium allomyrinae]|uniref:Uncharacterized protein n=1 Tax=Microbacterium allomyrinae TaxID=2830666 RepID=A0A9X1LX25_9MICO|nr:hypothetical protein [Microbacterium allomyrinae]MCC2033624.1 hypothetical protein [Microbacterium allomyrinae]